MATGSSPPAVYSRGLASGVSTIMALLGSFMKLAAVFAENKTSASFDDLLGSNYLNTSFGTTANSTNTSTANTSATNTTAKDRHTMTHPVWVTTIVGILAVIVMILTILGNITVLLAFGLERTIRQPTNYFLASLAVSDLLIGTFSMPLYTQYALRGKWLLGEWLCDLWLSLDWTVCLTSQYTVFLITMDRYLSVKIPAKYRNWRTEKKVLKMISVTWVLPALVFFTSIIGWQYFVGKRLVGKKRCEVQFMSDARFTFLLTIGYFWITLFVIGVLYFGIYKVALDLQKKSDAKHKKMQSTMELAGDGPNHHDRLTASAIAEGNNSGDSASNKQGKSGGKANNRKSVRAALPCPLGVPAVNTTSFSTNKAEKDDDRSSSPAFASDDENSSSGGAAGVPKSPMPSGVYIGRPNPAAGIVNSALFANTGGLVRSLHGDLFFGGAVDKGESQSLLASPPTYSEVMDAKGAGGVGEVEGAGAEGNINGTRRNNVEDMMYSSASDRLEKQTTPLLQDEINKGSKYIDEKSFMANVNPENIALLPDLSKNASQFGDDDVNDVQTASSPIWKRRHSLPPVSSDAYDIDDEISEIMMSNPTTTATSVNNTPVASRLHGNDEDDEGTDRRAEGPRSSDRLLGNENDDKNNRENGKYDVTNPNDAGGGCGAGETETTAAAANNVASSTAPDQSSNLNNNNSVNDATPFNNNNTTTITTTTTTAVPSDTNEEESSRSDTHCLSAAHRRRNKDTRLHTFVKSVRSRNSRRRNRRERKSKSENRARKALRTITIILGAFIVCWTPYHICLMVVAICKNCLNTHVYTFTYWMCYLNSPINPFCYAFANTQFKRTFLRIMKFDWHRT